MAAQLHYLTVQDILWINLQVTGKVNHFNFAKLEEATYYQYAYGDSKHLVSQAARFLPGFMKLNPIEAGNEATAFIALLTFLKINGNSILLQDNNALAWLDSINDKKTPPAEAIDAIAKSDHGDHAGAPDVRKIIRDLINDFAGTLPKL
jgi:prophage maintenance system killer protein